MAVVRRNAKIYIDVNTWQAYDEAGDQITRDTPPKIVYKEQVSLTIQYLKSPPAKPIQESTLDKYDGFAGKSITSTGVIDNNWNLWLDGRQCRGYNFF